MSQLLCRFLKWKINATNFDLPDNESFVEHKLHILGVLVEETRRGRLGSYCGRDSFMKEQQIIRFFSSTNPPRMKVKNTPVIYKSDREKAYPTQTNRHSNIILPIRISS